MSRHKNSLACYACDLGASVSVPFTQKSKVFDQKYNQYSAKQEKQMSRPMDQQNRWGKMSVRGIVHIWKNIQNPNYCYWGRKTKLGLRFWTKFCSLCCFCKNAGCCWCCWWRWWDVVGCSNSIAILNRGILKSYDSIKFRTTTVPYEGTSI